MRTISLAALVLAIATLAILWSGDRDPDTSERATAATVDERARAHARVVTFPARPEMLVARSRYRLRYRHTVRMGDEVLDPTVVKGIWTTEPLVSGRVEITFTEPDFMGQEILPEPEDVTRPFQLGLDGGRLAALGFERPVPTVARELLTTLAVAFAYTPGQGDSWTVDEEDRTGLYRADYRWSGDEVVRTRQGFLATRTPAGALTPKRAAGLTATGDTRYRFDESGLASVVVDEHMIMHITDDLPPAEVRIKASLERIDAVETRARTGDSLALASILPYVQHGDDSESKERERLAGKTLEELARELNGLRSVTPKSQESKEMRRRLFKQFRALVRLYPERADELARMLAELEGDDTRLGAVLTGALGSAGTPFATNALARVMPELQGNDKTNATIALGLTQAPTSESAAALGAALGDPSVESVAALALGTQAKRLVQEGQNPGDAEIAEDLVDTLLAGYERATTTSAKATYISALGNTGDARALPVLERVIAGGHTQLAPQAVYALRFMPGESVDVLLDTQLATGIEAIQEQAVRAIGNRDPNLWRERLTSVYDETSRRVQRRIDQMLRQWG